jgi:hypothetical protein
MADSALERYLKDKQLEEQTPPGKNRSIEELKESFQDVFRKSNRTYKTCKIF